MSPKIPNNLISLPTNKEVKIKKLKFLALTKLLWLEETTPCIKEALPYITTTTLYSDSVMLTTLHSLSLSLSSNVSISLPFVLFVFSAHDVLLPCLDAWRIYVRESLTHVQLSNTCSSHDHVLRYVYVLHNYQLLHSSSLKWDEKRRTNTCYTYIQFHHLTHMHVTSDKRGEILHHCCR